MRIATLSTDELAEHISAITPNAFFLDGTVRSYIDPKYQSLESTIFAALRSLELDDMIHQLGGLGVPVKSESLSSGKM
jgi:ABC-type multidrug transport system fused ATPase/permease subunit